MELQIQNITQETNLYPILQTVLRHGEMIYINPVDLCVEYEDSKIVITGLLGHDQRYKQFYIGLKVQPDYVASVPPFEVAFGLPRRIHQENGKRLTTVYQAKVMYSEHREPWDHIVYFRAGRWTRYLLQLYERISGEQADFEALNQQPFDDSRLFSEIKDEAAS